MLKYSKLFSRMNYWKRYLSCDVKAENDLKEDEAAEAERGEELGVYNLPDLRRTGRALEVEALGMHCSHSF